jgi:phosphohistidine phosphatase
MRADATVVQVFLVRHAEAADETLALRDPHRPLTPHGRDQARQLGDRLRWHDCVPALVWSSPLVRAVQTAELVLANLHLEVVVEIVPDLAPDGDVRSVVAAIRALPPGAIVLLVGHEPNLSAIGELLTGDPAFAALDKAEAARVVDGQLKWRFAWDADAPS